ncbi:MAG TPA: hypothetical protein PKI19_10185 [Elusimicrobiales bacterium]|nr:hypothetical protein [Elusimicrobiales bacterium]
MKKEFLIRSINLGAAEALTLEKAEDRMEFEALVFLDPAAVCKACSENWDVCPKYVACPKDVPTVPDPTPVPCPSMK